MNINDFHLQNIKSTLYCLYCVAYIIPIIIYNTKI